MAWYRTGDNPLWTNGLLALSCKEFNPVTNEYFILMVNIQWQFIENEKKREMSWSDDAENVVAGGTGTCRQYNITSRRWWQGWHPGKSPFSGCKIRCKLYPCLKTHRSLIHSLSTQTIVTQYVLGHQWSLTWYVCETRFRLKPVYGLGSLNRIDKKKTW